MTRQRGRILSVTSTLPRWQGGATPSFVLHLAEDLKTLGWDVDILAPHAPQAQPHERLNGVQVERFRYFWPSRLQSLFYRSGVLDNIRRRPWLLTQIPAFAVSEWHAVKSRLSSGRYNLVHSHWVVPQGIICSVAATSNGIPHIITVHGGDAFTLRGRLLTALKRRALRHAAAITVNSSATRTAIMDVVPQGANVITIPMGASEAIPHPPMIAQLRDRFRRDNGPLLIYVGRLLNQKGVGDLLHALALLQRSYPSVTALVVGDGSDRPAFENLARTLK